MAFDSSTLLALDETPVSDVMWDREAVSQSWVTRQSPAKYKKLLDVLTFESCMGVPIFLDSEVTHAVFFFIRSHMPSWLNKTSGLR